MKAKRWVQLISMLLVLALIIQAVPTNVITALNVENVLETETVSVESLNNLEEISTDDISSLEIIGEVESLRSENEKHFRLEDGSYIAVSYGVPVHYQDESGDWQDIDNSLKLTKDNLGNAVYKSKNAINTTTFSTDLQDGKLLNSSIGDVSVDMYLLDGAEAEQLSQTALSAQNVFSSKNSSHDSKRKYNRDTKVNLVKKSADVVSNETAEQHLENLQLENLESTILYIDVYPNVDLQYTACSYSVKEQIIVNEPQSTYQYDFMLELDGLSTILNDDGSVSLFDNKNTEIYHIPAPFMQDANGAYSEEVFYTLTEVTGGAILTVTADNNWINAAERVFPVAIDPTLQVSAKMAEVNENSPIYATYVTQGSENVSHSQNADLYLGYGCDETVKTEYGYLHFNTLPTIPDGSVVTAAQLNMYMSKYSDVACTEMPFSVCEVTDSKPSEESYYSWICGLTWKAKPNFDTSNEIDYAITSATLGERSWEITELVKKWYSENTKNRTIAIVPSKGESYNSSYCAVATFKGYHKTDGPSLIVHYRSNVGIEPYYTYNTLSLGNSGAAYIANESGQLKVATPLVGYSSTVNPVSINLFYNSDYFTSSATTSYKPPMESGLDMTVGHGWTMDIIQKMEDMQISGVNYKKYTDGDGTIHYFLQKDGDTTYFYDEDGLGLKVTETSSNNYTMSDDHGNVWKFTNNYLTETTDSNGNKILINYTDGKITSVKQRNNGFGSITVATFEYSDAASALTKVTDAAGNVYTLTYSSELGNLTAVKRNNTTIARFRYNGHRIIRTVDAESSYAIAFDYSNGKISSYQEVIGVDSDDTTGAKVAVSYPNYSKTLYRDYGADRESGTSDDLLTHYLFDYAGRTVNAYATDKGGNIIGADNAVYSNSGTTDKDNNRTMCAATIGTEGFSILPNSSVESTDSYQWTLADTVVTTTKARTGVRSIKGTLGDYTQSALRRTVELEDDTTYTFSAYVNTNSVTKFTGDGVYLRVRDQSTDEKLTSQPINYKTSADTDGGWVRVSISFHTESASTYVVGVYCDGGTGVFYADDFQLEKGGTVTNCNLVENGDFEMSSRCWTLGDSAELYDSLGVGGSTNSIKITSTPFNTTTARAHQDVKINLPATETYVLSGWALANSVPDNTGDDADTKKCGLKTAVYYTDGTKDIFYAPFNSDLSGWQFVSQTIVPKSPEKTVERIRIICLYGGNANRAYFDKISLVREAAQTMKYDDDGNLVSVTTSGLENDVNTYEGGNLIKSVTSGYGTYDYTYYGEYPHRVKTIEGYYLTQTMTYDNYGNVATSSLKDNDAETSLKLISGAEYSGSGNLQTKYTDTNVVSTTYKYSSDNSVIYGIPTSTTDEKGTTTYQEINGDGRITTAYIPSVSRLRYAYSEGKLSEITRINTPNADEMSYLFTYDDFGNTTKINVGGRTLASYTYSPNNGLLSRLTYGAIDPDDESLNDAFSVDYTYDKFGRTSTVNYPNAQKLRYTYDGDGNIIRIKENGGSAVIFNHFTYDTLGRLLTNRIVKGTTPFLQIGNEYNSKNQLVGQSWILGSEDTAKSYSTAYTYNPADGLPRTMTTATGETLNINYDALRRLKSISGGKITRSYVYRQHSDTRATNQIASIAYSDLAVPLTYNYTYDSIGNISAISDPIDGEKTYTYDSQGQMLSETIDGTKYTYTYDNVGNILTSKNSTGSHTYTYTNNSWGDLLSSFDGVEFSYDRIGNPKTYYNGTNWTFTWQNGRQLATATDGTTSISYDYDQTTGMRQSKTVGSTKYEYYYSGDKLLRMTVSDGTVMDFFYNHLGQPYAVDFNGTKYYYILNQQGDVVRLVSKTGTSYGTYRYDAWGNILYSTNAKLLKYNPLRYRGYVYDTETAMYYCQSRYYDPAIGRFINADDIDYLGADGSPLSYNLFAYCMNNPVNRFDVNGNWSMPNWLKVTVGAVAIVGLAVATVCTGGAAAVICGAALSGAIAGGASGAVMGAIGGGISGGWQGALDGACSGFMSGTLIGGATGAASAGLNIATGATTVVGNAHGSTLHKLATNMEAGKMAASGQYSQIGINKSLGKMGLNGGLTRPDVIGIGKNGVNKLVEVVSPRQSTTYISTKMSNMLSNNPGTVGKIVNWVRRLFK